MRRAALSLAITGALSAAVAGRVPPQRPPEWRDGPIARLQALALLETLNADLLSHDSATLTLDRWCAAHDLARPAQIVAERQRDVDKPATADLRTLLGVGPDEPVRYRRVRLACGGLVLSEADNWYVPARLTPEMNRALDETDIAFGRAVAPLHFQRHTLSADLLWNPLPPGWETGAAAPAGHGPLAIPHYVLRHRAVLTLPDGTPFSTVTESYTSALFAFPQPPQP